MNDEVWKKVGRGSGWLALVFVILSIVSGFAWDVRTSELMSALTGGLLTRMLAVDLHTYALIPLILTLIFHVTLSVGRRLRPSAKNSKDDP